MQSYATSHVSDNFLQRISLGQSLIARRCGVAFLAVSVLLSPLIAERYRVLAVGDQFGTADGMLCSACWLFVASEIRLFTAGRPIAFHWFLPEPTNAATLVRSLKFCVDVSLICFLAYDLGRGLL
jgi:hypothetical protein